MIRVKLDSSLEAAPSILEWQYLFHVVFAYIHRSPVTEPLRTICLSALDVVYLSDRTA